MTSGVVITGLAQPSVHNAIATQSQSFGKILQDNFFKHNPQANGQQNDNGQGEDFWKKLKEKLCWEKIKEKVKDIQMEQIKSNVEGEKIKIALETIGKPTEWKKKIEEGWGSQFQDCNQTKITKK